MTALQQRNPLSNISNNWTNEVSSKNTAIVTKDPSAKTVPNPWSSHNNFTCTNPYYQATSWFPPGNIGGDYCDSEACWCRQKGPGASSKDQKTYPNQYFGATRGYSYSSGWNYYGPSTYPQGYYWPARPNPCVAPQLKQGFPPSIPKPSSESIQKPVGPERDFLPDLSESHVKSTFSDCMEACSTEKGIKPFEDLLTQGIKLKHGWLKRVFVKEDVPKNKILKLFLDSILLTFDGQVQVGMRAKLAHAWGTTLDRLRRLRNLMKESVRVLPSIAKHQIDFRGHKTNPFLMYNANLEIQQVQKMFAELGTKAKQLEDKVNMEKELQLKTDKIMAQERWIDALRKTERTLEEENKRLSNSLKHWKSCYSKVEKENDDLKTSVYLPNLEEV